MGRRPRASWRASKWIAAIGLGMLLPAMFGTPMLVRPHARAESIGTTWDRSQGCERGAKPAAGACWTERANVSIDGYTEPRVTKQRLRAALAACVAMPSCAGVTYDSRTGYTCRRGEAISTPAGERSWMKRGPTACADRVRDCTLYERCETTRALDICPRTCGLCETDTAGRLAPAVSLRARASARSAQAQAAAPVARQASTAAPKPATPKVWPEVRPNARRRGAADGADIHVVFTTSCNQYQRWQAEMVAHTG